MRWVVKGGVRLGGGVGVGFGRGGGGGWRYC